MNKEYVEKIKRELGKPPDEKVTIDFDEIAPQSRLSPTSIIEYKKCPRCYFYRYIAKLTPPPNIHLVKGSVVHSVLENLFKRYSSDLGEKLVADFNKSWDDNKNKIRLLELTPEQEKVEKLDAFGMVYEFFLGFKRKMDNLIKTGKAENESHAFHLLKPKFREKFYKNEELHACGFVDRIHEDYDGIVTIGDYKTSKKYGIGLKEDYKLQLAIYSLLYKLEEQKMPDFAAIIFLRYGEEYILEVTPSLLRYALDTILEVWEKTRSTNIEDYPPVQGDSSRWCTFLDLHDGTDAWKAHLRQQKIREMIEGDKDETD